MMPVPLDLPEPSIGDLEDAPLQLVVCQIRHERNMAIVDVKKALAIQAQLGDYDLLDEGQQSQIDLVSTEGGGVAPSSSVTEHRGWRLRSSDRTWTAALLPDYFALECSGYTTWPAFFSRLESLVNATTQHLGPAGLFRLGLRYIERIDLNEISEPQQWRGYINDHLLGPLLDQTMSASITAVQQIVQFAGTKGYQVALRHGVELDDTDDTRCPYVLDTDCWWRGSRSFDVAEVLADASSLHRLALQIFELAVTPKLLVRLKEKEG